MPNLSTIIVTFDSLKFIKDCLDSIFIQDCPENEVIVIDNGSKDGTAKFVKDNYPQVILIENQENLGVAKARNQGIDVSKGKWVLCLDCDTVLRNDYLPKILEGIKDLPPGIGMVQPKILNFSRNTIYSAGILLSCLKRFYDIGKNKKNSEKFNNSRYIFGVCAASALYNRRMLEEIKESTGYFDDRFIFLAEDVDLAWRAQSRGWKALYYPDAICYHHGNSSSLNKACRQYLCWRNRKLLLKKCKINKFSLIMMYLAYDLPRAVLLFFTNSYIRNAILTRKLYKYSPDEKRRVFR